MRKQAPFRHPIDISHDERIAALIGERGHAGYGLYWLLIEIIHREQDMRIPYNEVRIRRLSAILGITTEELKNFVGDLLYIYELLIIEDDHIRSAISYRRPRKPRPETTNAAIVPAETAAPIMPAPAGTEPISTAIITDTEIILSMPTSPYSPAKYIPTETDHQPTPSATFPHTNPTPSTEAFSSQQTETYSFEDFRFYTEIQEYIACAAPRVAELPQPFTRPQVADIRARFDEGLILDLLEQMQHDERLTINHASAYHAFLYFASAAIPHPSRPQKRRVKAAQGQRKGRTTTP